MEVLDALDVARERGHAQCEALRAFGLTLSAWERASRWWTRFFAQNATREGGTLYARYVQLRGELRSLRESVSAVAGERGRRG